MEGPTGINRAALHWLINPQARWYEWYYTATNGVGQLHLMAGVDHRVFQLVPEPWRGGGIKSGQVNKLTGQCRIRDGIVKFETTVD